MGEFALAPQALQSRSMQWLALRGQALRDRDPELAEHFFRLVLVEIHQIGSGGEKGAVF